MLLPTLKALKDTLSIFDGDRLEIKAAYVFGAGEKAVAKWGNQTFPVMQYGSIQKQLRKGGSYVWIIGGSATGERDEAWKMAQFLMDEGIPRDRIINGNILPNLDLEWVGNMHWALDHGADIFATGSFPFLPGSLTRLS